jgi:hypothetical protein
MVGCGLRIRVWNLDLKLVYIFILKCIRVLFLPCYSNLNDVFSVKMCRDNEIAR